MQTNIFNPEYVSREYKISLDVVYFVFAVTGFYGFDGTLYAAKFFDQHNFLINSKESLVRTVIIFLESCITTKISTRPKEKIAFCKAMVALLKKYSSNEPPTENEFRKLQNDMEHMSGEPWFNAFIDAGNVVISPHWAEQVFNNFLESAGSEKDSMQMIARSMGDCFLQQLRPSKEVILSMLEAKYQESGNLIELVKLKGFSVLSDEDLYKIFKHEVLR